MCDLWADLECRPPREYLHRGRIRTATARPVVMHRRRARAQALGCVGGPIEAARHTLSVENKATDSTAGTADERDSRSGAERQRHAGAAVMRVVSIALLPFGVAAAALIALAAWRSWTNIDDLGQVSHQWLVEHHGHDVVNRGLGLRTRSPHWRTPSSE